ncbi:tripartite tricarboxylate transporter substrate binding protein [Rubrobacter taiwanensis]|uniref:Tripartite tricarboxylate transporter substrate binding protein n=1 Tax=Rubrobacter taiwanensis TaxID=185139 RepID=A0A4R1BQG5_9ACTN|nr:tripartite tricarboxylate transporter substrate binding protein [Rubrobacter taiwanensis]TCJ19983.1 tripartite tricarboxylate transporter substrate binding protein [Rubrobacter taiwanensis]
MKRLFVVITGLMAVTLVVSACAADTAEDWPQRPIEVTVGWSAGGSSDLISRTIAREMEEELGVTMQITNVEGATGGIGAGQVARAPADGYRVFAGASVHGMWPVMDLADVGWEDFYAFLAGFTPTTIYVADDSPYQTIEDLVAAMEEDPGSLRFGTPGPGSNGEILVRVLFDVAGLPENAAEHVPYGGGSEAGQFLAAGEVDFISVTLADVIDLARDGQIRPLGNLFPEEMELAGLTFPSIIDSYPELEPYTAINPWFGMYLSRETDPEIVERFTEAFLAAVEDESFRQWFEEEFFSVHQPTVGQEADEVMSQIESARGWALYDLGMAPNNPAEMGIPQITKWSWPPHERAEQAEPWPEGVQAAASGG